MFAVAGYHAFVCDAFIIFMYKRITINNGLPHLKSPKNQKQKCRHRTARNKITGGGVGGLQLVCGRPTLALGSAVVP